MPDSSRGASLSPLEPPPTGQLRFRLETTAESYEILASLPTDARRDGPSRAEAERVRNSTLPFLKSLRQPTE
jgi:hypothetical protein